MKMNVSGITAASACDRAASEQVNATRSGRLRQMLRSERLEFLMEAHNGLPARIACEAGFDGIWASGLAISAQFGVRDNNVVAVGATRTGIGMLFGMRHAIQCRNHA